jgi:hypothetical protein
MEFVAWLQNMVFTAVLLLVILQGLYWIFRPQPFKRCRDIQPAES